MIRKFRMIGLDNGVEIDLTDFDKYLLTLPNGLGLAYKNSYITLGSQRIRVKQERQYENFTGTIEVCGRTRDEWEKNYDYLRDFIASNLKSGIKLYYSNRENQERYLPCDIKLLSKTEKSSYCILVGVQFEPKGLWKNDVEVATRTTTMEIGRNAIAFMRDSNFDVSDEFGYNYGFIYDEGTDQHCIYYMSGEVSSATLINNADSETPLSITIYGECVNPFIVLEDTNGNEIQACQVYVTLYQGDKITLNSDPANLGITLVRSTGNTSNITTSVDTSLNSFLTLPVGTYRLRITEENTRKINGNIKYSLQYIGG